MTNGSDSPMPRCESSWASEPASDAPRKRSTSGSASISSALCRSTMQPTATTARHTPSDLYRPASTNASMDSFFAASIKPQVLTIITSASARSGVNSPPYPLSSPRYRSLSTVFLSQPSVTKPTFTRGVRAAAPTGSVAARRSAVVAEFELDAEVFVAEKGHCGLKVISRRGRDADLIALNRRLHLLELRILDRGGDFLCGVAVQGHLELYLLGDLVATGGLHVADVEILRRYPALDELCLEHLEQRLHPELALRREIQGSLGAAEFNRRNRALEVIALRDLLLRLIDGVVDFLEVHSGRDIE